MPPGRRSSTKTAPEEPTDERKKSPDQNRKLAGGIFFRTFRLLETAAAIADGVSQIIEQNDRVVPAETGVRDALAVDEGLVGFDLLVAFDEVRLDHDADDRTVAAGNLLADVVDHIDLFAADFVGIAVGSVNHYDFAVAVGLEHFTGFGNALGVVIGLFSASENDVTVFVSGRGDNGRDAALGNRQE